MRTLTDYANSQEGNLEPQIEECQLKSLITTELKRVEKRFKSQRILQKLDLQLPDQTRHVTDPSRLASMLHGLMCNVYLHSHASEVAIQASLQPSTSGENLCIEIKDNGVGIPADIIEHIDQPFANFQKRKSTGQEGLGVGLYLNTKHAQAMHGSLRLSNLKEGGTLVNLTLPVKPGGQEAGTSPAVTAAPPNNDKAIGQTPLLCQNPDPGCQGRY